MEHEDQTFRRMNHTNHHARLEVGGAAKKVLVVDDEWLLGEGLKADLEDHGCTVLGPALSCPDALDILAEKKVDLAFLDTRLGDQTCEPVLAECDRRSIPVVIYTGYSMRDLPDFALGRKVLGKPYQPEALDELLGP
jgi:CheY-like chemotaxis protein